ncbi:MAG: nicotinate-nucleotide adenylyltransferase [Anaerolineaceae bacterium]|nr:nicotinate-nucleotide adenylyltransferase [Anaerolineaceae bacterium]
MARLGIFGGTFDPPHLGHMILAAEARYQLRLDRLLWVLTPAAPHKMGWPISLLEQRLALVQAAIQQSPDFEISGVDIDREPPYYSEETMRLLKKQYPDADLIYLMGGDSLHDLPDWHDPLHFMAICSGIGVMRRPGDLIDLEALESRLPGLREKIRFVEAPLLEISARQIRERIANGRPYRYYLLPAVYEMIKANNYYLDSKESQD